MLLLEIPFVVLCVDIVKANTFVVLCMDIVKANTFVVLTISNVINCGDSKYLWFRESLFTSRLYLYINYTWLLRTFVVEIGKKTENITVSLSYFT